VLTSQSKSQLAIQYAHRVRDAAPRTYVFWVHASTRARFNEAYQGLADRLELPGRLDPKADVLRLVSNWLCDEANGQWTMVVDNVDDVETFFPSRQQGQESAPVSLANYLPQSRNGSILITSRSRDAAARLVGGYHNIKEVLAMDESQGLQLLHNKLSAVPNEDGAAVELLRTLNGMPLAITQAAAYIKRRARMTIAEYLSEFRANDKRRESLLNWDAGDLRRDESASNSVVTTWQISFERIQQERPSAAELLSLMSFFNPQGIPERTLRRWNRTATRVGASDNDSEADRMFQEDIDTLLAYSLIATADNEMCEMHALVQFCMRVWLSSFSEMERWKREFVELLAQEFPSGQFENWKQCEQLLPHVEPLYDIEPASELSLKAWAQVLTNAAWYLQMKGRYPTAQAIATKAIAARERILGSNNNQTLISIIILASVLRDQGKYEDAEKLNWRALEGYEKELGAHHPNTLMSVSNLARVLQDQGKYEDAEKLSRRALEGREKELGVHHPDTLTSVYCLAHLLHMTERYAEATELYERAYNGYVQKLGAQHPDTIACGNCLSTLQEEAAQAATAEDADYATHCQEAVVTTACPESAFGKVSRRRNREQASFFSRIRDNFRARK
jgi:tetratricopeptide (TPR) repeat protein